jgi:hypothetical protein
LKLPEENFEYRITDGQGRNVTELSLNQSAKEFTMKQGNNLHSKYKLVGGMNKHEKIQRKAEEVMALGGPSVQKVEGNKLYHEFEVWAIHNGMKTRLIKKVNLIEFATKMYTGKGEAINNNNWELYSSMEIKLILRDLMKTLKNYPNMKKSKYKDDVFMDEGK